MSSIHYIYTYNTIQSTNLHYYRFLQGPDTKKEDVQKISDAIKNELVDTRVSLLNYKKNGETFQNEVSSKRSFSLFCMDIKGGRRGYCCNICIYEIFCYSSWRPFSHIYSFCVFCLHSSSDARYM